MSTVSVVNGNNFENNRIQVFKPSVTLAIAEEASKGDILYSMQRSVAETLAQATFLMTFRFLLIVFLCVKGPGMRFRFQNKNRKVCLAGMREASFIAREIWSETNVQTSKVSSAWVTTALFWLYREGVRNVFFSGNFVSTPRVQYFITEAIHGMNMKLKPVSEVVKTDVFARRTPWIQT